LIIHPKDPSTDFLKPIYALIEDKTVITGGVSKRKLKQLINDHDRIIMCGHGSPMGLFAMGRFPIVGTYVIDSSYSDLLSQKQDNIFIWCHACHFVQGNGLNGFHTGMFISEVAEAFYCNLGVVDSKLIDESNECFASIVSRNIHKHRLVLYKNVRQELYELAETNPIARFNMEQLYYI